MSAKSFKRFKKQFKKAIIDTHDRLGNETAIITKESFREVMEYLHSDARMDFDFLKDVTCVDYLHRKPRFEMVYILYSMQHKHHIRIRVPLEEDDLTLPTVCDIWRAANWGEREVWEHVRCAV